MIGKHTVCRTGRVAIKELVILVDWEVYTPPELHTTIDSARLGEFLSGGRFCCFKVTVASRLE